MIDIPIDRRGMTISEVAAYLGISKAQFTKLRETKVIDLKPLPFSKRARIFDRKAVDKLLDTLSGVSASDKPDSTAIILERLKKNG